MKIELTNEYYNLAKSVDFSILGDHIRFNDSNSSIDLDEVMIEKKDVLGNKYKRTSIRVLLGCISDEVSVSGLSQDQKDVLPRGRKLYELYDGIYYSVLEE